MPNLLLQNKIKIELWVLIKREDTLAKCWKCQTFTLIFFWHMQEDMRGLPESIPEGMLEGMLESMLDMAEVPNEFVNFSGASAFGQNVKPPIKIFSNAM